MKADRTNETILIRIAHRHPAGRITKHLLLSLFMTSTFILLLSGNLTAGQVKTPYATLHFESSAALHKFNARIGCTYETDYCLGNRLAEASVGLIVSDIVHHVERILNLPSDNLHFHIHVLKDPDEVQYLYQQFYKEKVDYIAFYSPQNRTIYIANSTLQRKVLAHEIVHAIVDNYFIKPPPVQFHEVLAKYLENEI